MSQTRLTQLRKLMKKNKLDAYLVPGTDPHQSEYVPDAWHRRQWLSGFTGSAGDLAILKDKAGLWTDSRYFLQAEDELNETGIELFKIGVSGTPAIPDWLCSELEKGSRVGLDPAVFSHASHQVLKKTLTNAGIRLVYPEDNLIDQIWSDRPALPDGPVTVQTLGYSGQSSEEKLDRIREKLHEADADCHILTSLDAIAWTFNIRSRDVDYNPVCIAFASIGRKKNRLFVNKARLDAEVTAYLSELASLEEYDEFEDYLKKLAKKGQKVWLDPNTVNARVAERLEDGAEIIFRESPVTLMKAIKNTVETEGFRNCHIRDGLAMVKFLHWLEKTVPKGGVTELTASDQLEAFRAEDELFQGPSFETISSYAGHGAIVHYAPSPETDIELKNDGIYLIDSGGQYLDGTTDITRTVALGKPTKEQKDRFTRILMGFIDLTLTRFPVGTQGIQLDTIARKYLWDAGLNYGHGTGHGVGSYLSVHEGPQGISYYRGIGVPLVPGMVCSNEPAFYKTGEYGLRVESMIVVKEYENEPAGDFKFLGFETFTLCPIDLKLVEQKLLSAAQLKYLNDYHKLVREKLSPFLNGGELSWLKKATKPLKK